eukprot:TRINITY_DN4421_c0_g2_i1.p1 TRINITY_DN4421_c0_g2~~TRINITY_DN4421_c0_g2_i1.p1  ORF type:complete len:382 (+),score=67.68 TRINITY_DN4421_c0_g2_i1:149-1147(+)
MEDSEIEEVEKEYEIKNHLVYEIGDNLMNLLWDMFIHVKGPRIRDRLAHGEASIVNIPHHVFQRILQIFIYLTLKYIPDINIDELENDKFAETYKFVDGYISCFHPRSLLQKSLVSFRNNYQIFLGINDQFYDNLESIDQSIDHEEAIYLCKRPEYEDIIHEEILPALTALREKVEKISKYESIFATENNNPLLEHQLLSLKTVHCSPVLISKISVCTKIIKLLEINLTTLNSKIGTYKEKLAKDKLSTRQENSFYKLLGCIECLHWIYIVLATIVELECYADFANKMKVKFLNKVFTLTKHMQNKLDANRWEEIIQDYNNLRPDIVKIYRL